MYDKVGTNATGFEVVSVPVNRDAEKIYSGISAQISVICRREKFFSVNPRADLLKKISLIPLISRITAEKIYSGISAQISVDLREKRVFLRKSAPICRRVFII
ncbi:MAG TPA: hypothetical protein VGA21_10730 [Cyclobacteriaceae bacterium]